MDLKNKLKVMADPITIISIIVGVVGIAASLISTYNWSNQAVCTLTFAKDVQTKYTDYYDIGESCDVALYQNSGSSSCKYKIYYMKRNGSKWNQIGNKEYSFSKNGDDYAKVIGSYSASAWLDVRVKGYKTAGTSAKSEITVIIGY